ncbi:trypsin-like peptidase domain-containing protein [Streptomyces enissocaesilis]|uniref:Novel STAND NTPase 1 domain-containing protein n=1 Tax=Streptomyces enissocaesilis TaxID=332589 RepID=A0ABN3WPG0_9ACTN
MTRRPQGRDGAGRQESPGGSRAPDPAYGPEAALVSAVVRVKGRDGVIAGAGFLVADDLVLTCAHVVSDALDRPREKTVEPGAEVAVDLPLAGDAGSTGDTGDRDDGGDRTAEVRRWIPVQADRTGDLALLRLRDPIPGARPLPLADPPQGVWHHHARAVGFTEDHPGGIWHSGTFRGPTGEGWVQLSRGDGEGVYVKRGFSGSPVWDDELGAAVGLMVAAGPGREAQQAFALRTRTLLRELPELASLVTPPTPFRGLATFREADAGVFFGRGHDIEKVVTALHGDRPPVTLYGPSGCGKSSLALAGVVPRMREAGYAVLVVNAGHIASLRSALATELYRLARAREPEGAESAGHMEAQLAEGGLADALHRALGPTAARVLVVVDQAESLLDRTEAEVAEAARLLFPKAKPGNVRVLLTLRADFVDAALNHPVMGPALKDGTTVPLTPMSGDQLADVISEPVRHLPAVAYDPGLEQRILDDAGGAPGILPLLGFVLTQLWDRQSGGRLRLTTYDEIGGVHGALARHAEQAWRECVRPADEADALRLLTGLVRVLPGSEAPLRRMLTREETGEARWRIARALAERRLLVLRGKEGEPQTAELAHEALTSAWPTLADQVRTDSDLLAARAELRHDLDRWETAGRSPDLLPGPIHLASLTGRLHAREAELSPEERAFIDLAARRHRLRRARVRVAWGAAALVLALIAGLGTFLVQQSRVGAEREAEGRSRSLASLSEDLVERDPGAAALVAMAAHDLSPTQEASNALLRRYDHFVQDRWALTLGEAQVDQVATSTDGRVVLVTTKLGGAASSKGGVVLFVRGARERIVRARLPLAEDAFFPMVSRDGRRIAYLSTKDGGTLVWHDVDRSGTDESAVLGRERSMRGAEFGDQGTALSQRLGLADLSPDAREVVTSTNGRVRIRELATERTRELPGQVPAVDAVWFGPDKDTLVAQPRSGAGPSTAQKPSLVAIGIGTGAGRPRELADGVRTSQPRLALSGNGAVLVVCREGRPGKGVTYEAVRVADGRMLTRYRPGGFSSSCSSIAIDGTGEHFAVSKLQTAWALVGTRPGAEVREIEGPGSRLEEDDLSLVGDPADPVLIVRDETSVTGQPLDMDPIDADGPPVLLGGTTWSEEGEMLVRMGDRADTLGIVRRDTDGSTTVLKAVRRPPRDNPSVFVDIAPGIEVDREGTLAADLIGWNKVRIWELPSLRTVTDITVRMPPPEGGPDGPKEGVGIYLGPRDELLTVSGSTIEHWNARDGRRLSKPLDVRDLGLTATDPPDFTASFHPEPGHVQLSVHGDRFLRAFSLRTGRENGRLRIELGPETDSAVLDRTGRFATVQTKGSMMELWSVGRTGKPPQRVLGPMGPLNRWKYRHGFQTGSSVYFLANRNSMRFQDAADPENRGESYVFAEEQTFLAVSGDGRTLLRTDDGNTVDILHLDPELWKKELCDTLGRDLSEDERRGLPVWLPDRICPPDGR